MGENPPITDRELYRLSDERLLALVVDGRPKRRGPQWETAKRAWRHLAARNHDRARGLVVSFRFPGQGDVRVSPDDYDDATQESFIRAVKMLETFRGATLPEFLAALRTCVTNTCMDFCRRRLTRERGLAGSIDEPVAAASDDVPGRFDAALGEIAATREAERAAARDDLMVLADALERLDNEDAREVLRRKMTGSTSREIAAELGLTVANVDQLCSRGVRQLKEVTKSG